jgi:cystathionine beta-lyase/cystathionine gamma-synthase
MRFATKAVHVGSETMQDAAGSVNVPITLSATFDQNRQKEKFEYGRTANPTRLALERNLAALEEGKHALTFASGLAAETTLMTVLKQRDHVVCMDDVYGGTHRLFTQILQSYGLRFTFVDATDLEKVRAAVTPETRMVWVETPSNPMMRIVDLSGVAEIGRQRGLITVCDNTFASPYLQNPLKLGIDVVVHSTTKYLGGHSDVLGGAIVTSREDVHERVRFSQNAMGGVPSPVDCFLILRGIKTLAVRMERHMENAMAVAGFLEQHPAVRRVLYPGLPTSPGHDVASRQMRGYGGMVSFILRDEAAAPSVLRSLQVFTVGESLGAVESLATHPATMTHTAVPEAERGARGITPGLIRLSVGIEDLEDLVADLARALNAGRAGA